MLQTKNILRDADGGTVVYHRYGSGPRVLTALHSLALDGTWYQPLAAALGEQYTMLAPDFRGHGESLVGGTEISLAQVARDVNAMWDAEGVEHSVVMGISLGGMVAQAVTGSYPEKVRAQILMATRGAYDQAAATATTARSAEVRAEGGMQAVQDATMFRWFGEKSNDPSDELVKRARAQFLNAGGDVIGSYFEAMTRVGDFAVDTPPPTLVLGGDDDRSTSRTVLEALAASIPGAELDFATGGHLVAFENPEIVAERLRPFLERLSWERG